jgi:hypothetical protein
MLRYGLGAVLSTTACGGDSSTGTNARAALRGFVHETGGNDIPIEGVSVVVQGVARTTDSGGMFTMTGLSAGETQISLSKAGYVASTFAHTLAAGDNTISIGLVRE